MAEELEEKKVDHLQEVVEAFRQESLQEVHQHINKLHPAEIAHLLESLPADERESIWELVEAEIDGEVLLHLNDEVRAGLMRKMDPQELVAATENLDTDDLADILPEMPGDVVQEILLTMEYQDRQRLEAVLSYPEDTAGGLMNVDTVVVRADISLDVVLRYLRRRGEIPETTDILFVANREAKYLGTLGLTDLLTNAPDLTVAEVMHRDVEGIPATTSAQQVANLFERRDLVTAPVVDDEGHLLGRITIDDVVDVIRDEAEHSFMSMAGLTEDEDMFAPVLISTKRRAVWLGVNLLTAFLASWVIGLFDATINKLVALAVLMPIVASMGGIAGSQTLTLVIRGLALGQIGKSNTNRLMAKEIAVGLFNGLIWALFIAAVASLWFKSDMLGVIIGAAMIINLLNAALVGVIIPLVLRKVGADPALAGSVILTTFTDCIGYASFLGLATLFLVK